MDRYLVNFTAGLPIEITSAELDGIGRNLDTTAQNFQWLKRPDGWIVISMDKVTNIIPKSKAVDAVVTPPSPDKLRADKERAHQEGIASMDAILDRHKKDETLP